jgi:hypothetical protein
MENASRGEKEVARVGRHAESLGGKTFEHL